MKKNRRFDEFYSNGKVELTMSGNLVSIKSHYSKEEIVKKNKIRASHYDEVKLEIDNLVDSIVTKISKCDPLLLLKSATDMVMTPMVNIVSETQIDQAFIARLRLIEYIQSILISQSREAILENEERQQELFIEIFADIENLYKKSLVFIFIWAAKAQEVGDLKRKEIEYIVEAQLMSYVRGHRYQFQQLNDLEKLLLPHSEKFVEIYGETAESIISGLRKLESSLSSGKLDSFKDLLEDYEEFQKKAEGKTPEELVVLLEEKRQSNKTQELLTKYLGTELYNVKKVTEWDDRLVESLSWSLGENTDFFQKTEYPGWPIQDLPVQKKPFIKINDISYCFDYYNLFDNIYRIIQKNLKENDPAYVTMWSQIKQEASESLVADKFAHLLPNASIYIGNYYPATGSLKQMDENDIFVICDDVVIIAEVKAGSFTYTSALTDYKAHERSFEALIGKADYQCIRTQKYLQSNEGTTIFYNKDKSKKFEIDKKNLRRIFNMCITVDNFNTFEAKIEKTNFFNVASGTIAISIDDLDIYENYFNSEIQFLHFLRHRKAATRIKNLILNDELDHLGMYIIENAYEEYVNNYRECNAFVANGFREDLDAYYAGVYNSHLATKKPVQVIPDYFNDIFALLECNKVNGRIEFGEFLLEFTFDEREEFDNNIRKQIRKEKQLCQLIPIWGEYDWVSYCCFICVPGIDSFTERSRKLYAYSNMMERKQEICWYIFLEMDSNDMIKNIYLEKLLLSKHMTEGFSDAELKSYTISMNARRKANGVYMPILHKKKIYPNDLCSCGSGIKYKKCCGKK